MFAMNLFHFMQLRNKKIAIFTIFGLYRRSVCIYNRSITGEASCFAIVFV